MLEKNYAFKQFILSHINQYILKILQQRIASKKVNPLKFWYCSRFSACIWSTNTKNYFIHVIFIPQLIQRKGTHVNYFSVLYNSWPVREVSYELIQVAKYLTNSTKNGVFHGTFCKQIIFQEIRLRFVTGHRKLLCCYITC